MGSPSHGQAHAKSIKIFKLLLSHFTRLPVKSIIAIDASSGFSNNIDQFMPQHFMRDLIKSYCGFYDPNANSQKTIATGSWGCGGNCNKADNELISCAAYAGNVHLKALQQMYVH